MLTRTVAPAPRTVRHAAAAGARAAGAVLLLRLALFAALATAAFVGLIAFFVVAGVVLSHLPADTIPAP